jgi:predicted DNA binding CopG/RHH family protein
MGNTQVKTKQTAFKLTPEQFRVLQQRAAHSGVPLSTWMRSILTQAANQKPRKGILRIREPDGATT